MKLLVQRVKMASVAVADQCFVQIDQGLLVFVGFGHQDQAGILEKAIEGDYRTLVTDEEREELHEIHKNWPNYSVHGMERNLLPEKVLTKSKHGN